MKIKLGLSATLLANNIELDFPNHISVLPLELQSSIESKQPSARGQCYKINLQIKQGLDLQSTILNGLKSCLQSTIILPFLSTIYTQYFGQIYNLQNNHTPPSSAAREGYDQHLGAHISQQGHDLYEISDNYKDENKNKW